MQVNLNELQSIITVNFFPCRKFRNLRTLANVSNSQQCYLDSHYVVCLFMPATGLQLPSFCLCKSTPQKLHSLASVCTCISKYGSCQTRTGSTANFCLNNWQDCSRLEFQVWGLCFFIKRVSGFALKVNSFMNFRKYVAKPRNLRTSWTFFNFEKSNTALTFSGDAVSSPFRITGLRYSIYSCRSAHFFLLSISQYF